MGFVALAVLGLLAGNARAATKAEIDDAIRRGVALLKSKQQPGGSWPYTDVNTDEDPGVTGPTSLAALTLLECGVPAHDIAVRNAADLIRAAVPSMTDTYSLSLAIMLFDRLGDSQDEPRIQALTVRILAGEGPMGGWTYQCPPMSGREARWLRQHAPQSSELVARQQLPKKTSTEASQKGPELPPIIREQLARIENSGRRQPLGVIHRRDDPPGGPFGDNSNTQFACLALWVARRHHLPVDTALSRVEERFRKSQHADGGWGYTVQERLTKAADTCIGLFALAMGRGVTQDRLLRAEQLPRGSKKKPARALPAPEEDLAIRRGLTAVGSLMRFPEVEMLPDGRVQLVRWRRRREAVNCNCYFLWSLERMAVVYGLKTVGNRDWYAWGTRVLLARQTADGGWEEQYHPVNIDTCFALLFLRRANLATDLTTILDRDPGTATLRARGSDASHLDGKDDTPTPERPLRRLAPPTETAGGPDRPARTAPTARPTVDKPPAADSAKPAEGPKSPLSAALVGASGERQEELIRQYEEAKGIEYTDALADAIHHLRGPARTQAQSALADRLSRSKAATLRVWLQDDDAELRRAAALACAGKQDESLVPDLIELLKDANDRVAKAAHLSLRTLTQQDFGPGPGASAKERADAAAKWKAWWAKKR
jgi:hypothetical protein